MSSVTYLIGKTLGKYEVLEHIGHGGMSEVYKGQQVQLNRMVAIKVLHPFLADDTGFVTRFQREARIVATLRHPNIVQVYDFDCHDELGIYYMVMEYIEGPTLKDRLEGNCLSCEEAVRVGASIADALDYAHQRGMIHRDIKPANIMFLNEEEPVLTDFGIAKMLTLSGLTASGAMVGTPAYMAPEIGIGKSGTASSDIYSLSVVIYHSLTGCLPFTAESPMGMVMEHINTAPPSPCLWKPEIPEELGSVILRGLEKDPADRFETAGQMADALRGALAEAPSLEPDVAKQRSSPLIAPPVTATSSEEATDDAEKAIAEATAPADRYEERIAADAATALEGNASSRTSEDRGEAWQPVVREPSPEAEPITPQRSAVARLLRVSALAVLALVVAGGLWLGLGRNLPPGIRNLLAPGAADAVPATRTTSQPALTRTLTTSQTTAMSQPTTTPQTVTPVPTAQQPRSLAALRPSPTPTLACTLRVKVDQIRVEPGDVVAPGTPLLAYITLRNGGKCSWPAGSTFHFAGGHQLGAPEVFPIAALGPGEGAQILAPLTAPEELGTYRATWELRGEDGTAFGSPVVLEIAVEDVPRLTPTPSEALELQATTRQPLEVAEPVLLSWEDAPERNRWSGVARIEATGGSGQPRYFEGQIRASTELPDGEIAFEWYRCEPYPVDIWVLSGAESLSWQGEISFPAPEECE
ncbi:MAG: protein kinase domain-containing protein [Anaerolineae bacterium]